MFGFIKKETHSALEEINERLKLNASNNYRDATIENINELEELYKELLSKGRLNRKQADHYDNMIRTYRDEFKNFDHKSQKAGW